MSKIWENTYGFSEQYRCASAQYVMKIMSQCYSIIIDQGISELVHGKEVVYGLNAVYNGYIYINLCTLFNFMDQTDLINRCKCTLATKTMM